MEHAEAEIRAAGLTAPHGVVLGRLGRQILCDDSDTHDLLVAPSRAGKGVGPILCTLFTWLGSTLVYDPADGENYDASHGWREALGHRVEQFTPRRSPQACINVVDLIRVGRPEEFDDAWTLADSLVAPEPGSMQNDTGKHFRRQATTLLIAGLLHMLYTEGAGSLGKLWTLLTQRYATLAACVKAMLTTAHTKYGRHPAIVELSTAVANISSDRELSGVWTTATGPLLPYADYLTQRSTDTSTITLDDLQHGPVPLSLYLVAPSTRALGHLYPVYRVVTDMAIHRLETHKPRSATHRLLVIADEAPAYGYSATLDKGCAEAAKYAIKMLIVAQDIPQLEDTFGRNNSIWGNTATKMFFAPDSDLTAKRLSENFLGPGDGGAARTLAATGDAQAGVGVVSASRTAHDDGGRTAGDASVGGDSLPHRAAAYPGRQGELSHRYRIPGTVRIPRCVGVEVCPGAVLGPDDGELRRFT